MIKSSIGILSKAFLKIFNNILTSGKFPESWTEGLITPIHKSGNSLDPNNYRGICVSSCMGKLFCSILNNRLMNFAHEKQLIHPTQIGFMPGNRTASLRAEVSVSLSLYYNAGAKVRRDLCRDLKRFRPRSWTSQTSF